MTDHSLAAHRRYVRNEHAILRDQHLSAELKIVGVIMRRSVDLGDKLPSSGEMARMAFTGMPEQSVYYNWQRTMADDIRRYDPYKGTYTKRWTCQEPLPRAKRPCGRSTSGISGYVTDIETGEKHQVGWCTKHVAVGARVLAENREALKDRIVPRPYANTGGYLRVHLPELDWDGYWRKLDPNWEPFPERQPISAAPTLQLLTLDVEEAPAMTTARASHPARGRRLRIITDE